MMNVTNSSSSTRQAHPPDPLAFGDRLRDARTKRGYTLYRAGELTGINHTYLSLVETGKRPISPERIAQLAQTYGVSVLWLVTGIHGDDVTTQEALKVLDPQDYALVRSIALFLSYTTGGPADAQADEQVDAQDHDDTATPQEGEPRHVMARSA